MFRGITSLSLDSKGRLSIPARYREALSKLVVVPNPIKNERCLLIYPINEWEKVEADVVAKPNTQSVRHLKRFFLGQAVDYSVDNLGRVLLTPPLRDYAGLTKKMVLIGQGNKFELWDESVWQILNDSFLNAASDADVISELESLNF